MERVCVFCGSSEGLRPGYAQAARRIGGELARRGLGLVYGGGKVGLMGAVADAALATGGEVVGVMPDALVSKEIGHEGLTELHVVGSMHERKKLMADLSDGFVALPGGYGTLEEFLEQACSQTVRSMAVATLRERSCPICPSVIARVHRLVVRRSWSSWYRANYALRRRSTGASRSGRGSGGLAGT